MTVARGNATAVGPAIVIGPYSLILQRVGNRGNVAELVISISCGQPSTVSIPPALHLGYRSQVGSAGGRIVVLVLCISGGISAGTSDGLADDLVNNILACILGCSSRIV